MNYQKIVLVKDREFEFNITSSDEAVDVIRKVFKPEEEAQECLWIACLNNRGDVVGVHEVSRGSIQYSIVSPMEILKRALLNNATGIIVAHNHPSGNPEPSVEDETSTMKLSNAVELLGMRLVDHIIFGGESYYSMKEGGVL